MTVAVFATNYPTDIKNANSELCNTFILRHLKAQRDLHFFQDWRTTSIYTASPALRYVLY